MNILMIVTWFSPEGETITAGLFHYELAVALQKYEHCQVAIFHPYASVPGDGISKEISGDQVRIYRAGWKKGFIKRSINYQLLFSEIKKDFCPDIIHAHCASGAGRVALQLSKQYQIPYCVSEHSPPALLKADRIKNRFLLRQVYKHSSCNTCVSDYMTKYLREHFRNICFETVYNGVDIPDHIGERKELLVSDRWNVCICAEFYDREIKGYQYLIPAVKLFNEHSRKKIFLHVCGDGIYKETYEELVQSMEIEDSVRFYGHLDKKDIYRVISTMDYCVSASMFESAGVFVEESLWFGKPIVVTCSGGADSLVNEQCAIIVDKGSSEALAEGFEKMQERYESFSPESISTYAQERFGMKGICNSFSEIYNSAVQ